MSISIQFLAILVWFIIGMLSLLAAIFHLTKMVRSIRSNWSLAANLFWPVVFLSARALTEEGRAHRRKFFVFALVSLIGLLPGIVYINGGGHLSQIP